MSETLAVTRDIYIPRGESTLDHAISVASRTADLVEFYPQGGGFQQKMPATAFDAQFRHVPEAERRRMAEVHYAIRAGGDWVKDEDQAIPAWTNGARWNGWVMPAFTKETLLAEIAAGRLDGVYFDERRDAFVTVTTDTGTTEGIDIEAATGKALADNNYAEYPDEKHGYIYATVYPRLTIQTPEGAKEVYEVGAGSWCWEDWTEPAPAETPSM